MQLSQTGKKRELSCLKFGINNCKAFYFQNYLPRSSEFRVISFLSRWEKSPFYKLNLTKPLALADVG